MSEALSRMITMLTLIPRFPETVTARELHRQLTERGHTVAPRTVDRDVKRAAEAFPLQADDQRVVGWSWRADAQETRFPVLDASTALGRVLLEGALVAQHPAPLLAALAVPLEEAHQCLEGQAKVDGVRWLERVVVVPGQQTLNVPEIPAGVADVVYAALLAGRRLLATHQAAASEHSQRHSISPLGLVLREGVLYLVGSVDEEERAKLFALHRLSAAALTDVAAQPQQGFDLRRYIREAPELEFPHGGEMAIELHVSTWLAQHLAEQRLSDYQAIRPIRGGDTFRVTATVTDSPHLLRWLRGFGEHVEVMKPAGLRRRLATEFKALAQRYD